MVREGDLCPIKLLREIDPLTGILLDCLGPNVASAGSQPDHAFPETGGYERSQKDTKAQALEFERTMEGLAGHARTCDQDGSGP